jgi:hypothetical protein
VTEWLRRDKSPGELILCSDRQSKQFYDYQESCKIALRDGWGLTGGKHEGETDKAYASRAAMHDYKMLKAWCDDEWSYCGIVLSVTKDGIDVNEHAASLWGIELNYPDSDNSYLNEVANELLDEAIEQAKVDSQRIVETLTA